MSRPHRSFTHFLKGCRAPAAAVRTISLLDETVTMPLAYVILTRYFKLIEHYQFKLENVAEIHNPDREPQLLLHLHQGAGRRRVVHECALFTV